MNKVLTKCSKGAFLSFDYAKYTRNFTQRLQIPTARPLTTTKNAKIRSQIRFFHSKTRPNCAIYTTNNQKSSKSSTNTIGEYI